MTTELIEKQGYHATLWALGVKKRCRKPDCHNFELVKFEEGEPNIEELTKRAVEMTKAEMKELKGAVYFTISKASYDGLILSVVLSFAKQDKHPVEVSL